jgi:nucleotide-binding universal stress UspA family protein
MYHNILLPVAFEQDLNLSAPTKIAQALAAEGATIHLLHVFEILPSYAMQYVPSDTMEATKARVMTKLKAAAESIPGAEPVVVEGAPGRAISNWASKNNIDLIVMPSHQPGMGDLIWGSTAAFVVRHASCAVHVIR